MHVVAIIPHYPPNQRIGSCLATHELLTALVAHGHTVDVFTKTDAGYLLDGVRVHPGTEAAVAGADLIVSHAGDDGTAPRLATKAHKPSVRLVHGHYDDLDGDLVVFNSHATQRAAGYRGNQVVVRPTLRNLGPVTPGDHVTLVNLSEAKGGELFFRLARCAPHLKFLGVQGGYGRQTSGNGRNVTVTGPTRNIEDVFNRTRVLLTPADRESWGMVGVEALSCGIPVIAHPTEGLMESLGDAGIFIDRENGQGWLDELERLRDPHEWQVASARARAHVAPDDRDRFVQAVGGLTNGGSDGVSEADGRTSEVRGESEDRQGQGRRQGEEDGREEVLNVAVLVPRRADRGRRDQLWDWVRHRWQTEHPSWLVTTGNHEDGPFNRSAAINLAARAAGEWDVAVIADSDSFVGAGQIETAVATCVRTGQMTLAYDRFAYLSREMSDRVMGGFLGDWTAGVEWSMPGTCSSMVVVTRAVWDESEGFDEGFVGWGGEDIAFSHKAQTFGGGLQRIPGFCWHLWHPPAVHAADDVWVPRCEEYAQASYDRDAMHALIARLRPE